MPSRIWLFRILLLVAVVFTAGCTDLAVSNFRAEGKTKSVRFREPNGHFSAQFPTKPRKLYNYFSFSQQVATWQSLTLFPSGLYEVCWIEFPAGSRFNNEEGMRCYVETVAKDLKYYRTERTQFQGKSAFKVSGEDRFGRPVETYVVRAGRLLFGICAAGSDDEEKQRFLRSVKLHSSGRELFASESLPTIWSEVELSNKRGEICGLAKFPNPPQKAKRWFGFEDTITWTTSKDDSSEFTVVRFDGDNECNESLDQVFARVRKAIGCPPDAMERGDTDSDQEVEWVDEDGATLRRFKLIRKHTSTFGILASTVESRDAAKFVSALRLTKPKKKPAEVEPAPKSEPKPEDIIIAARLRSSDSSKVRSAFSKLKRMKPKRDRPQITAALQYVARNSNSAKYRVMAIQFLVGWGNRASTKTLVAAMDDHTPEVQKAAYRAVALRKERRGMRELFYRLEEFRTRRYARDALEFAGPRIIPELGRFVLSNADASARSEVCRILAETGSRAAIGYLKRAQKDDEFFVQSAARHGLKDLERSIRRQRNLSRL